jgi:hypothetical protein
MGKKCRAGRSISCEITLDSISFDSTNHSGEFINFITNPSGSSITETNQQMVNIISGGALEARESNLREQWASIENRERSLIIAGFNSRCPRL